MIITSCIGTFPKTARTTPIPIVSNDFEKLCVEKLKRAQWCKRNLHDSPLDLACCAAGFLSESFSSEHDDIILGQ